MTLVRPHCAAILLCVFFAAIARAQHPTTQPIAESDRAMIELLVAAGDQMTAAGTSTPAAQILPQLSRRRASLQLPAASKGPLSGEQIYSKALRSTLIVGGLYKCDKCKLTHANVAGAFLISADGVAVTNYHVMNNKQNFTFVAMSHDRKVYAIKEILAADPARDVAIIRLAGDGFEPLPLERGGVGADVWVLSHPNTRFFSFSRGMISRYFHIGGLDQGATRMQITADFAKGSSGGPVLDSCGNVVGMVASTQSVVYNEDPRNLQMVFKDCVPAQSVLDLVQPALAQRRP